MYLKQPKKMLIVNILDILRKYSDAEHRLSQADIAAKLKNEYDMETNRKTIKPNIMNLIDFGYDIEYTETVRANGSVVYTDFYLNREFTDEELRILIDSLLFSKYIPYNRCKKLVQKIEELSSVYFKYKVRHITSIPEKYPKNNQIFFNISIIDEAIEKKRKIQFRYLDFGVDKKLKTRKLADGSDKTYCVSPYQMAATNSRYYLICYNEAHKDISYFRVDRIKDISLTDEKAYPIKRVYGCENGLDLPKHMAEHIYMFSGESDTVIFRADKRIITDIIDWFGTDVVFMNDSENEIDVRVNVNLSAMHYWAMQYANYVKILSPQSLVDTIKNDLRGALEKYDKR